MGDWSYLLTLLHKVQSHSTIVGKIWMSVLFLFRIFVLGAAADNVWADEVSEFYCDTQEPGCEHACYNWKFPISFVHYWVLQITFVSTPTLVFLGYAVHIIHKEKKMMEQLQDGVDGTKLKKRKYTDDRGKVKLKGTLFCTYVTQLFLKIFLEVGFSVSQFFIFGSPFIHLKFHCKMSPCAEMAGAQCMVSRPTEKTIFIFFMLAVSGISVLLNIMEIIYLCCTRRRDNRKQFLCEQHELSSQYQPFSGAGQNTNCPHGGVPLFTPPARAKTGLSANENHSDSIVKEKDT
ncbi:gap junction Cx32.2 protein-like isoform X2 [Simochromis diagramma]|nr:gap junction Cx32.2 protein-like isoform X2 [Simochromis diagramma]